MRTDDPYHSTVDLTGDGLPDLIVTLSPCADDGVGDEHWLLYENTGAGFASTPTNWSLPSPYGAGPNYAPFALLTSTSNDCATDDPYHSTIDLTGDGLLDLVITLSPCADDGVGDENWLLYENTGTGFASTPTEWPLPSPYGANPGYAPFALLTSTSNDCATDDPYHSTVDLTGDGLPDLIVTLSPCADDGVGDEHWLLYENTGTGFANTPTNWSLPSPYGAGPNYAPFALLASTSNDCATDDPYHSTIDLTGDGLPDLIITLAPCADDGVGDDRWLLYENTGTGFAADASSWPLPPSYGAGPNYAPFALLASTSNDCATDDPYHSTIDLTGDGLLDLVVTLAPCADDGVGTEAWRVYEAVCDL